MQAVGNSAECIRVPPAREPLDVITNKVPKAIGMGAAGIAMGLAALCVPACRSLDKEAMLAKLQGLAKNRALAEQPLLSGTLPARDGVKPDPLPFRYLHLPASKASDKPPLVLVHGTPGTLYTWSRLLEATPDMRADRDIYALEILGNGFAPGVAEPCTFETCARYVGDALRALQIERAWLVGNSYGGEYAWRAALNDPDRIAGLILMHPSGFERTDEQWLPEERAMRDMRLAKIGWWLNSEERIERALAPHFRGVPDGCTQEMYWTCDNASNWRAMVDLVRDENGTRQAELVHIACPTLLVWGAEEIAYPVESFGRRFADAIPGSELVVLDDCGHYPQEEQPDASAAAIQDFLARAEAAAAQD
ncbi:MAG: alpha/beta hydrolase [Planctomycetota bacterium]